MDTRLGSACYQKRLMIIAISTLLGICVLKNVPVFAAALQQDALAPKSSFLASQGQSTNDTRSHQMGKQASVEKMVDHVAYVRDARGQVHSFNMSPAHLAYRDPKYFAQLLRPFAKGLSRQREAFLLAMLNFLGHAPFSKFYGGPAYELPRDYVFTTVVDDLFGFYLPNDKVLAIHSSLEYDPIALFHEAGEYLMAENVLQVKFKTKILSVSIAGKSFRMKLDDESIAIVQKDPKNPHYLLRALQRFLFGAKDKELTRRLQKTQMENREAWDTWLKTPYARKKAGGQAQEALGISYWILQNIATHGILSQKDQEQLAMATFGSVDYALPQPKPVDEICTNILRADNNLSKASKYELDRTYQGAVHFALRDNFWGIIKVMMERSFDAKKNIMSMPSSLLEKMMEERAGYGVIFILDPEKLLSRDRKSVSKETPPRNLIGGSNAFEVGLKGPVPLRAIQAILVPRALESLVRGIFPTQSIVVLPNRPPEVMAIMREPLKSMRREGLRHFDSESVTIPIPDYESVLMDYLNKLPAKGAFLAHGVRLMTPSDMTFMDTASRRFYKGILAEALRMANTFELAA